MVPFVKWAGGKRQLLAELRRRVPDKYDTYHEPFVGGGALFFNLSPKKAIISDINGELINAYRVLKQSLMRLREYLLLMQEAHDEDYFQFIRKIDRNNDHKSGLSIKGSKELRAARFIYLNKACFNGLYRVNRKGFYNVPSAQKIKVQTHDFENLCKLHDFLETNDIRIRKMSYIRSLTVEFVKKNDFVYLDPPYDFENKKPSFTSYHVDNFDRKDQAKLAAKCQFLDKIGVRFMLSNRNTSYVNQLYKGFKIEVVNARRAISANGNTRNPVEEVIIRNYG